MDLFKEFKWKYAKSKLLTCKGLDKYHLNPTFSSNKKPMKVIVTFRNICSKSFSEFRSAKLRYRTTSFQFNSC